jgi:tRNA A-37 threonylcarbamoyl transferase component Bud32
MTDVVPGLQSSLAARYVVEREVGEGATARVFLASDTKHDRRVALKILRPELANALSGERFLREIRVAAGLQHPNILALYDSGETTESLYFVMPYVEGETLRERLDRGGALPLAEAVRILTEIADALTYAHAHGVVHRDVKPENILLADGHAYIGDFGIAYAVRFVPEARLTGEGRIVGTAPYMSPEQAAGDDKVEGASDQYSLACVFYEMLAGRTLFPGRTPRSVIARRFKTPAPHLRRIRRDVPAAVDRALAKALAEDPAARFPTPKAFAEAVSAAHAEWLSRRSRWRSGLWPAVAGLAAVVAGVWVVAHREPIPPLDRSLYAVMPFTHAGSGIPELAGDDCQLLLLTALSHWRDVRLADELRVKSAYAQHAAAGADLHGVLTAARALGAGMMLWGDVRPVGDSIYVRAALYDVAGGGRTVRQYSVRLARGLSDISRKFRQLADSLILHEPGTAVAADAMGTSSLDAWRAYAAGHRALGEWELVAARRAFERAVELDPQYPQAYLWLAQTGGFEGMQRRTAWRDAAARAAALRERLAPADRELALALLAIAEAQFPEACSRYRAMLRRDSLDFRAWYGLGDCQALDRIVVEDARSPSGWRFRSSQAAAIAAYARALALTPSAHRAFRGRAFARLNALLYGEMSHFKRGYRVVVADTSRYGAFPSLDHDTLTFVPYPLADLYAGKPETRPATHAAAVGRTREALLDLTAGWMRGFPTSVDAVAAYAHALEVAGQIASPRRREPSALQMTRRARALAIDSAHQFRLASNETRLLLKIGDYDAAASLADSLLSGPLREVEAGARSAGLAALVGRAHLAAALAADTAPGGAQPMLPDGTPVVVPGAALRTALSLEVYGAFGGPTDTLRALWNRVLSDIRTWTPADQRERAIVAALHAPAPLVYPVLGPTQLHRAPPANAPWLLDMQAAVTRGDHAAVLARLESLLADARANPWRWRPTSSRFALGAAQLALALGDTARAVALLDFLLDGVPAAHDQLLEDAAEVAALVRAMAVRADLATAVRDHARAARWAGAVAALWQHPDPVAAPTAIRMRAIARAQR